LGVLDASRLATRWGAFSTGVDAGLSLSGGSRLRGRAAVTAVERSHACEFAGGDAEHQQPDPGWRFGNFAGGSDRLESAAVSWVCTSEASAANVTPDGWHHAIYDDIAVVLALTLKLWSKSPSSHAYANIVHVELAEAEPLRVEQPATAIHPAWADLG
jgi:hypothetical protein